MGEPINHRRLIAWQEAIKLVELVYRETSNFPREEAFGLKAQIRRSAVSISSNIAEGAGRNSSGELIQFLGFASGSRAELDTHLEIAVRLGFIRKDSEAIPQLSRVGKLLVGLRRSLKHRSVGDQT